MWCDETIISNRTNYSKLLFVSQFVTNKSHCKWPLLVLNGLEHFDSITDLISNANPFCIKQIGQTVK